ncbi:MAG: acetyl-CoA carboxylase biotin carboxyl carrier protein [Candidatus Brocadiia bacterium]|jgi:acetyl-CoA carboxylase biotin carboxyl carrier protein
MDLQDVMKLLELMEARHLEEIEVEQGETRIRLRKGGAPPVVVPIAAAPAAAANPQAVPAASDAEKAAEANLVKITSPMVGTFYRAASPDAEPFINEGDHVTPDQVICIIEAMKVMNEIKAEREGDVVSILIENGESVEFGQPMVTIRRTGTAR